MRGSLAEVEDRVDSLENILGEFIVETRLSLRKLSKEMKDFKDEMKDFKDESLKNFKQVNKQWGELSNKMGTLVEDIISPAVRPVIQKYFEDEIVDFSLNRKKFLKELNLKGEFDVIAVSQTSVYLVEVKSNPQIKHLESMETLISNFKILFPEYLQLKLIPIVASLRFDDDFIEQASKYNYYVMAYREWEYLDILNFDMVK